ncbi:hypothetical protein EF096_01955 [Pseudomonas neustonica]|uniref:Uncharacterized protein n=1 Tax=Pseudomonas neustonica TaxID=2487346 RepID=A0ABX9XN56_9PSED|nr:MULTISPECIES: hypothetical protein [Pseudomonas]ROZ86906.1 hypothetical protein EF099_00745 [Pseudomonas sp. SSM44]ROZ88478.1 hypothetical protein EF096_01955 [Pseudomonas neustonica]
MGSAKDQRISETLMQNLAESMPRERPSPALKRERKRGGIAAKRGYFERQYQPGTGETTGGIASPLEEVSYSNRLYHTSGIPSTDGLFVYPLLSRLQLEDDNGAPVTIYLAGTSEPTP